MALGKSAEEPSPTNLTLGDRSPQLTPPVLFILVLLVETWER